MRHGIVNSCAFVVCHVYILIRTYVRRESPDESVAILFFFIFARVEEGVAAVYVTPATTTHPLPRGYSARDYKNTRGVVVSRFSLERWRPGVFVCTRGDRAVLVNIVPGVIFVGRRSNEFVFLRYSCGDAMKSFQCEKSRFIGIRFC